MCAWVVGSLSTSNWTWSPAWQQLERLKGIKHGETVSEWSGTRGQRPMSLSARPHEQLNIGVPLSWQREPGVWISVGVRPAGVGMREMAWSRSWSRTAASWAHMSSCQQLERLGSRDNCGTDQEYVPSCWIHLAHVCTHTQSHCWTPVLLSQRGGVLLVLCLCNSSVCLGVQLPLMCV